MKNKRGTKVNMDQQKKNVWCIIKMPEICIEQLVNAAVVLILILLVMKEESCLLGTVLCPVLVNNNYVH